MGPKNKKLQNLKRKHLPKCVQNGIPPAMSAKLEGPFWDTDHVDEPSDKEQAKAIGIPIGRVNKNISEASTMDMKRLHSHLTQQQINKLNARQSITLIKQQNLND